MINYYKPIIYFRSLTLLTKDEMKTMMIARLFVNAVQPISSWTKN